MKALKAKFKTAATLPADIVETLKLARSQASAHVQGMDEADPVAWARIIALVRQVGLTKETLCRELVCAWSTILRWEAGQTVPGPFARKAIKEKLMELLAQNPEQLSVPAAASRTRGARRAVLVRNR